MTTTTLSWTVQAEAATAIDTPTVLRTIPDDQGNFYNGTITIGDRTNIQDLACIHCDEPTPATLGNDVSVGHGAGGWERMRPRGNLV